MRQLSQASRFIQLERAAQRRRVVLAKRNAFTRNSNAQPYDYTYAIGTILTAGGTLLALYFARG